MKQSDDDPVATDLSRSAIEEAMDVYDRYLENGENTEFFERFAIPKQFWVRSTRARANRVYPSKPVHCWATTKIDSNGGWSTPESTAAVLHNADFIIVDENDQPVKPPDKDFLTRGADRIRLCALNYFIAPAREQGKARVSIRAGDLNKELMLNKALPKVCQALKGRKFQKLADVPPPIQKGPDASTTTTFTFELVDQGKARTMDADRRDHSQTATNLILYGPPGTGKTYTTAKEAVRLCLGADAAFPDRNALMAEYRRLTSDGRIEFVTFHQSFSYEDFVEGLRPTTGDSDQADGAGFRLEHVPGVFQRISRRAADVGNGAKPAGEAGAQPAGETITLEGRNVYQMSLGRAAVSSDEQIFEEALDQNAALFGFEYIDLNDPKFDDPDEILNACQKHGESDTDYSRQSGAVRMTDYFRNKVARGDILVISKGNYKFRAIGEVVGDYEYRRRDGGTYPHRRAVRWLWVDHDGMPVDEIYDSNFTQGTIYRLQTGRLNIPALERYMNSRRAGGLSSMERPEHFVLIIDEINRANISKVFGELITLLEVDKRLGCENELRVRLPYSGKSFGVPSNLHIIGTMNTADRSIALLDTALRRRFLFRELMPKPSKLIKDVGGINLRKLLKTINNRIEYLFDREHQIGHAYFIGCRSRAEVEEVMRDKVIPLLAEYFYEDWSKVAAVLGDSFGKDKAHFLEAKRLSPPAGLSDDEPGGEKRRWSVKEEFDFSEFKA